MPPAMFGTSRGALHPARSPQIEERLDRRHITYTFEPNFPVDRIRSVEGNQVRLSGHRAPKHMVDRYVEQMSNDAVFPGHRGQRRRGARGRQHALGRDTSA